MRYLLTPMEVAQTTGAMVRKNAAAGGQAAKGSRIMNPRPGDVLWLLSATGPHVVLVLGHARWGGGSEGCGLLLKALPTTGEGEFAPLSGFAQLQPDLMQPVNHVIMFNKLLDVEWICPPDGPGATAAPPTGHANAELRGALAEAGGSGHEGELEEGEVEARADRLRDEKVAAFEAEARREQAAAGERGGAEAAGRIPAGVVLHGGSAAGASSSSATGSTLPTASLGGGNPRAGFGSKRKLETGNGEEPEAARLSRARLRAREVGEPPAVSVSSTYRAAVLEGFRRVLLGARTRPDPEAHWAAKVPGRPFPFAGELARLKAEMSAASTKLLVKEPSQRLALGEVQNHPWIKANCGE